MDGPRYGAPWGPRRVLALGAAALAVVVVIVVTAVVIDGAMTRRTATGAAEAVAGWSGVTYRGQVSDGLGGPAAVEMTVDGRGRAAGTITRASGGRAEFLLTPAARTIRADEAWWRASAPRPGLATKLAGLWVGAADDQLTTVSGWAVSPGDLSRSVAGRPWSDERSRQAGGVTVEVLADRTDRISVDDTGDVPRLLEVELASFGRQRTSPVSTEHADPAALRTVATTSALLPSMPALRSVVTAPPLVSARADDSPTCTTPTCPVTYRLSNPGPYRTTGTLTVTLDDAPLTSFPFDARPGAVLTFATSYPNQAYAAGTAMATVRLGSRLVDLE